MTREIELKFFEWVGIKPDTSETAYFTGRYNNYPQISTFLILSILNIILEKYYNFEFLTDQGEYRMGVEDHNFNYVCSDDSLGVFSFNDAVLSLCTKFDEIKPQVQELLLGY
jgi:hypothetical protein